MSEDKERITGAGSNEPFVTVCPAEARDAEEILALQRLAYQSEAKLYSDWQLPPLLQTLDELLEEFRAFVILKAVRDARIVGSVRARENGELCEIGRLIVHPDFQRAGIGSLLMTEIEAACSNSRRYVLFTGSRSDANLRLYRRLGYRSVATKMLSASVSLTYLEKERARAAAAK